MRSLSSLIGGYSPEIRGVRSFRDWRFYLVALLLLVSTLCLMHDPYFIVNGEFVYKQGSVVLLMALLIAAAFAWETPIFGKPVGANLLLQALALVPFALLVTLLCASDGGNSLKRTVPKPGMLDALSGLFDNRKGAFKELLDNIFDLLPDWMVWLYENRWMLLLLLLVLTLLCFRRVIIRTAAICLLLILLFFFQINRDGVGMATMGAGAICLIAALYFMFCRYDRVAYYENVLARIRRGGELGREELRTILTVMAQLEQGGRLSNDRFRQIVKDCYSADRHYDDAELNLISGEVAKRMIMTHSLVTLSNDASGIFMTPDPLLFGYGDNLLTAVATLPRLVFIGTFALLWAAMPFDLIPDATPFVGTLDDVGVILVSAWSITHTALPLRKKDE